MLTKSACNAGNAGDSWVRSLGREDPLEYEMVTVFSIPAWKNPMAKEPGRLSPWGCKESDKTEQLSTDVKKKKKRKNNLLFYGISIILCVLS